MLMAGEAFLLGRVFFLPGKDFTFPMAVETGAGVIEVQMRRISRQLGIFLSRYTVEKTEYHKYENSKYHRLLHSLLFPDLLFRIIRSIDSFFLILPHFPLYAAFFFVCTVEKRPDLCLFVWKTGLSADAVEGAAFLACEGCTRQKNCHQQ